MPFVSHNLFCESILLAVAVIARLNDITLIGGYADGTVSGCRVVRRRWINVDAAVAHGRRSDRKSKLIADSRD